MKCNAQKLLLFLFALLVTLGVSMPASPVFAEDPSNFSLQVSPSPLVSTVKPGVPTDLDLKIRNAGSGAENLKIEAHSFTFDSKSGQIGLDDTLAADIAPWVSFGAPNFSVNPGEWYTQKVHIALPKEAGFSYSFALIISRQSNPKPVEGGRLIKGSVAVFTLVNVDKPGATRKLEIPAFKTSKKFYRYLPVDLTVQFKNTGNSIVQPYGNIFIQRGSGDKTPIATLPVNKSHGYILPGTERTLTADWDKGFPVYKTTPQSDGSQNTRLVWDWSKIADFRIGHYTAKLVAVYNDGTRDVPIITEVGFWVLPWKTMLVVLVAIIFIILGFWSSIRRVLRLIKNLLSKQQ